MTKTLWQDRAIVLLTAAAVMSSTAAYAQTKPAPKKPAKPEPTEQAVLLGQFGDWGAYQATPGGKKVWFVL